MERPPLEPASWRGRAGSSAADESATFFRDLLTPARPDNMYQSIIQIYSTYSQTHRRLLTTIRPDCVRHSNEKFHGPLVASDLVCLPSGVIIGVITTRNA